MIVEDKHKNESCIVGVRMVDVLNSAGVKTQLCMWNLSCENTWIKTEKDEQDRLVGGGGGGNSQISFDMGHSRCTWSSLGQE